jgi:hypothetical protein
MEAIMQQSVDQECNKALRMALNYIDSVPSDVMLPAMPGFDRDWLECFMSGFPEEGESLTYAEAFRIVLRWIDALPQDVVSSLPTFDRKEVENVMTRLERPTVLMKRPRAG